MQEVKGLKDDNGQTFQIMSPTTDTYSIDVDDSDDNANRVQITKGRAVKVINRSTDTDVWYNIGKSDVSVSPGSGANLLEFQDTIGFFMNNGIGGVYEYIRFKCETGQTATIHVEEKI